MTLESETVILNAAKNLPTRVKEILRCSQNDDVPQRGT